VSRDKLLGGGAPPPWRAPRTAAWTAPSCSTCARSCWWTAPC
jgi:hypothetical protein